MQKFTVAWANLPACLLIITAFCIPISTAATNVFFPLAILLGFLAQPKQHLKALLQQRIALVFLLFFVLFVLGTTYSIAPLHDILHRLGKLSPLLFAALLFASSPPEPWRRHVLNAFLLAIGITLVLSIIRYYWWPNLPHTKIAHKFPDAVFKDHIIQSFLFVIFFFVCFFRMRNAKGHYRYIYGLLSAIGFYNIWFVNSGRIGYLLFALISMLFIMTKLPRRKALLGGIGLMFVIIAIAFSSSAMQERMHNIKQDYQLYEHGQQYSSSGLRIVSYINTWRLIRDRPIVGYGTGSFATAYASLPAKYRQVMKSTRVSFSSFLNVWVELGIFGTLWLLYLFYTVGRQSLKLASDWSILAQVVTLSMFIGCFVNPWLTDTTELHSFCLLIPLCFAGWASRSSNLPSASQHLH